jgi:hypothetical protein
MAAHAEVNVINLGADSTGKKDSKDAINIALADESIYIPRGVYLITGSIDIPSNRTIRGDGSSTIFRETELNSNWTRLLSAINSDNITIENLSIDGNGSYATGEQRHNVWLQDCKNVTVKNIRSYNAQGDGLAIYSSNNDTCDNITIENCLFFNRGRTSISVLGYGINNLSIINNTCKLDSQVINCSSPNVGGIVLEPQGSRDNSFISIVNNKIFNGGITLTAHDNGTWKNVDITGNKINLMNTGATGISVLRTKDCNIVDNFVFGDSGIATTGMIIQDCGTGLSTGNIVISRNHIYNIGNSANCNAIIIQPSQGVNVYGSYCITENIIYNVSGKALSCVMTPNIICSNNIFRNCGSTGTAYSNCDHILQNGNLIRNCGMIGSAVSSSSNLTSSNSIFGLNGVWNDVSTGKQGISLGTGNIQKSILIGNDVSETANASNAIRCVPGSSIINVNGASERTQNNCSLIDRDYP